MRSLRSHSLALLLSFACVFVVISTITSASCDDCICDACIIHCCSFVPYCVRRGISNEISAYCSLYSSGLTNFLPRLHIPIFFLLATLSARSMRPRRRESASRDQSYRFVTTRTETTTAVETMLMSPLHSVSVHDFSTAWLQCGPRRFHALGS